MKECGQETFDSGLFTFKTYPISQDDRHQVTQMQQCKQVASMTMGVSVGSVITFLIREMHYNIVLEFRYAVPLAVFGAVASQARDAPLDLQSEPIKCNNLHLFILRSALWDAVMYQQVALGAAQKRPCSDQRPSRKGEVLPHQKKKKTAQRWG